MNESKPVNRIPFEDISSSAAWDFPSWDEGAKVVPSVKKKSNDPAPSEHERVEDVEAPEQQEIKPITAAQLQQITEEAEREGREHGYKQGYEQGFSEGEKKGVKLGEQKAYSEVKQRLDEERARFSSLADALLDPVAMQDGELENLILDMSVNLAKHLLGQELKTHPQSLYRVVKHAAASLPAGAENIRIYVNPLDVSETQEAATQAGRSWTFYPDPALGRGGCRIESSQSLIDFSIEQRLEQMIEEARFRGEVDPEEVAPVGDYRPAAAPPVAGAAPKQEDAAPTESAAQDEPQATQERQVAEPQHEPKQGPPDTSEAASSNEPAGPSSEGSVTAGATSPSVNPSNQAADDNGAEPTHPFGNPWDGRRE